MREMDKNVKTKVKLTHNLPLKRKHWSFGIYTLHHYIYVKKKKLKPTVYFCLFFLLIYHYIVIVSLNYHAYFRNMTF